MNRTGSGLASIPANSRFGAFLIIDAEPALWAIAAASVIKVLAAPLWSGQALDLDTLFASPRSADSVQHVLVVRTALEGTIALCTKHTLRMESLDLADLVSIPQVVFGAGYRHAATKHLILRENARPLAVLDVDALRGLAVTADLGTGPSPTVGEPVS
jgi:hypothetical protein